MHRVTLKAVAQAAGVNPSTASLALRNCSRISQATRDRVMDVARRMGYRPDPVLAALNAYRLGLQAPVAGVATLGWLEMHQGPRPAFVSRYLAGAKGRARELGFTVDEIATDGTPVGQQRAARILLARGIRGLLIPPVSHGMVLSDFPWDKFSSVSFGYSLAKPELTRVTFDHVSGMSHLLMELQLLGYRRVGLHITNDSDATERTGQVQIPRILEGAYLSEYRRLFGPPPPVFYQTGAQARQAYLQWVNKQGLDAIVLHGKTGLEDACASGLRIPEDIGVAVSIFNPEVPFFAGIDQNDHAVGQQAVDTLDGLLRHNTCGEPVNRIRVLVCGRWQSGESVTWQKQTQERALLRRAAPARR
uniref:LacI family DNA-binding transcriptional regulator n=1 Tax=Cephaloticoccus sp. TaxID=1985742 RepID=UPI004049E062